MRHCRGKGREMAEKGREFAFLGAPPLASLLRKWRKSWILRTASIEDRFTEIYRGNWWQGRESVSGGGSSLDNTADVRAFLPPLLKRLSAQTLLDAPCGDFHWMREIRAGLDVNYIGADIVKDLIDDLQRRHGDSRTRFERLDVTRDLLPAADLMMARDFFIHLSLADAKRAIGNFARSNIKYLLASTAPAEETVINEDMRTGKFRRRSLFSPPFHFPRDVLAKFPDRADTVMCLWSHAQIARTLGKTDVL